jgi:hypothetical protein
MFKLDRRTGLTDAALSPSSMSAVLDSVNTSTVAQLNCSGFSSGIHSFYPLQRTRTCRAYIEYPGRTLR